ncbi:cytochrome P450 [Hanseniaspora valbyensis NRRL Y-1626]|uniref:Cytochrome P450 n=1 Tax=Hanseniaspora valbyensis NRRL Y-1626 TaxID=766949 RepID=A0A1B7TAI9_9ASCO|nr:cytochrome P450 [Hanseniaspora valbyensis NRRL Y-1626]
MIKLILKIIITFGLIPLLLFFSYIVFIESQVKFSTNTPTVSFWVSFIPFFNKNIDQRKIWFKYIQPKIDKTGIVKIYFAGRWNLLVDDPEYMNQLFKNEYNIYHKSGNNEKIPNSLLAYYTGTNIISAHGNQWSKFRKILLPGFLNFNNYSIAFKNGKLFCNLISSSLEQNSNNINFKEETLTKYDNITTNISEISLGFNIGTLTDEKSVLYDKLNLVKKQIFKPLFMAFPFLDNLPIKSRQITKQNIDSFKENLFLQIQSNLISNFRYEQESYLNPAANLIKNNAKGALTKKELLDNLTILLVAGHENPQLLLTSLIFILAKYKWAQNDIRKELLSLIINDYADNTKLALLGQASLLNSVIYETIRLYPPIGQLINRKTAKNCYLTSSKHPAIYIKKGTYIGYNNFGLQRRENIWGKDSNEFKPSRWGENITEINGQWKKRKSNCEITAFHGGNRNCIGEEIALNIMRITICEMVTHFEWNLADDWVEKFTPAGPICPTGLKINICNID